MRSRTRRAGCRARTTRTSGWASAGVAACRRVFVASVVAAAAVGGALPNASAQAAPPPNAASGGGPTAAELAAAKRHYADGEKKYRAKDYAGALDDFRAANDIKPTPHAERYIGLCVDALGHPAAAADWYAKFLAHVPDKMAAQGDEIRRRLAEIQAMPGKVHVDSTPPGAEVVIDDKPQSGPTPLDVELPPGSHTIALKEAGRLPAQRAVDVPFASSQTVNVELEPEPVAPPPPPPIAAAPPPAPLPIVPPPPETRSKAPAYVTGALAIAAAGVGTAFGILALDDKAKFDRDPTTQTADNGDTHSLIADMCFGVAVTFAVTSIVLFATKDDAPTATSASPPAPSLGKTADARAPSRGAWKWSAAPIVGAHTGGAGLVVKF